MDHPRSGIFDDEEEDGKEAAVAVLPVQRPPGLRDIVCPECTQTLPPDDALFHLERHREVCGPAYSRRGILRSRPCAKGCGRWFESQTNKRASTEQRRHESACRGEAPFPRRSLEETRRDELVLHDRQREAAIAASAARFDANLKSLPPMFDNSNPREEAMATKPKLECPKCGKPYQRGGKRYETHVAKCDGKRRVRAARKAPTPPPLAGGLGRPDPEGNGNGSVAGFLRDRAAGARERAKKLQDDAATEMKKAEQLEEMAEKAERL